MDRVPDCVLVEAIVGVPQPVPHAANIRPWLTGHEFLGGVTETECRLANPFEASLDRVPRATVSLESRFRKACHIAFNAANILQNVFETNNGIVP